MQNDRRQSSRSKSRRRPVDVHGVHSRVTAESSKGEGSASKSKRGSKASGKHGIEGARAKTASEEIQLSIRMLLHDNEPDAWPAGVRPRDQGVVPENWARGRDHRRPARVARSATSPPAPSSSGCFAPVRTREAISGTREGALGGGGAPTRRRRCPPDLRRRDLERLFNIRVRQGPSRASHDRSSPTLDSSLELS